jgi:hypothetical protein
MGGGSRGGRVTVAVTLQLTPAFAVEAAGVVRILLLPL